MIDPVEHEEELFSDALARAPAERGAFLNGACGGDAALRARVERLLLAHEGAAEFLETRAAAPEIGEAVTGVRIGRYKLLERLGSGGVGEVFRAAQEEPVRREVALKVIKPGMDTRELIARFESERQALALMDHPHIAKVFDAGATAGGRPYFVMELVPGEPITNYCDARALTLPARLELFTKVCAAIQHAHAKGVIHRDLKPSNILVAESDGEPVPKVIDFGIAKSIALRLTDKTVATSVAHFLGTPAYMSPEQAGLGGGDIDARSDVYSLGLVLHELLAGGTPFAAKALAQDGMDELRRRIREDEPTRASARLAALDGAALAAIARVRQTEPAKLIGKLRGELDWVILRCLEKDRTRRYASASALADDVRRHLRHEPVVAVAPSAGYRIKKFARRQRHALMLAAAGVAVLAAAGIAGWSWWQRALPPVAAPNLGAKSIAVLPLANLSPDAANAFFADGVHEDIVARLAAIRELRVVPRTSVMEYRHTAKKLPAIAHELGVAYVMEGSVRREGEKVRVTGQLINARTAEHVWAKSYDKKLTDIFDIQSELAAEIAGALQAALTPQEKRRLERRPTESLAAYELILKARALGTDEANTEPILDRIELLARSALELDPKFVGVWDRLFYVHASKHNFGMDRTEAREAQALAALEKMEQLAPDESISLLARAGFLLYVRRDYATAEERLVSLLARYPREAGAHYTLGQLCFVTGRLPEAAAHNRRALELNPQNAQFMRNLIAKLLDGRHYAEVQERARRWQELRPQDGQAASWAASAEFLARGETTEGATRLKDASATVRLRWAALIGDYAGVVRVDATLPESTGAGHAFEAGAALLALGDPGAARRRVEKNVDELKAKVAADPGDSAAWFLLARLESVAGDHEAALASLRRARDLIPAWRGVRRLADMDAAEAFILAWRGDTERALAVFARSLRTPGGSNAHALAHAPLPAAFRHEPRFRALLADPANHAPLF